ncbi:alkaline phosphatase PafA [Nonlabens ulvanivorans]|uniref:AlkP superfamily pyrophosphatase or phosphodiesterase n=2 Tax=Nonlabens ulvanivorans TaxID=906888 RepID=A0A084JVV3_NONUL|nr:alkaline phosphatase PafA [Nonlabens ulvanivorans]KEZ93087.1 alkaline phosphatase [Nonlabens ulvanivorans]PRX13794.1 putative AlkP superfamily pyrophosphatase or phosphodiesterase [Nonlabens ulvanivorans]
MKTFWTALLFMTLLVSCGTLSRKQETTTVKTSINQERYTNDTTKPKLVVGIVVDQMRYDYLTRFYNRYGEGGFKRLMNDGFNLTNNHYNFVPTYTAPGHASIYTGTSPMNNGIIGNNWFDKFENKSIYNASDDTVEPVGTTNAEGKMSPRRLLTTTVTDELELHTQGRSKVIGISIKDRGAILPAGHAADAAYWYRGGGEGTFISSTFYINELPQWVKDYNASNPSQPYMREWNTLYPLSTYTASGTDLNDFEKAPRGKETATFPYDLPALQDENGGYSLLKATPYGNSLVADFAIAALKNEQMGMDAIPDFLAISFSSTDYVGHQYGVNAVELEDTYLRLDLELERLLNALDHQVGNDNYTVFLTADHGAVNNPAYLQSQGIAAGYFENDALEQFLKAQLKIKYSNEKIIKKISNSQIFLDYEQLEMAQLKSEDVQRFLSSLLTNYKSIDKVFTREALTNSNFTNGVGALIQNGFHHKRSGDVVYVLEPGVISYSRTGSTHGSSQSYDTHVPLLFYGAGINNGTSAQRTHIIDIAPTISSLLGISFPNGATGNPILPVLK